MPSMIRSASSTAWVAIGGAKAKRRSTRSVPTCFYPLCPIPFGGLVGCLGSGPAANGFLALVTYLGLIRAPPHLQLVQPSPTGANGLYFPRHNEGRTRQRPGCSWYQTRHGAT